MFRSKVVESGFTLIEILIVIAIIAILAAMLLPALKDARDKGKQAGCINNLKQISIYFYMYMQDYEEYLPVEKIGGTWIPEHTNLYDTEGEVRWSRLLTVLYRDKKMDVFHCPRDTNFNPAYAATLTGVNYGNYIFGNLSYGYNYQYLGEYGATRMKLSQVKNPVETVMVTDSDGNGDADDLIAYPYRYVGDRHNGRANVLWVDGHVSNEEPSKFWGDSKYFDLN